MIDLNENFVGDRSWFTSEPAPFRLKRNMLSGEPALATNVVLPIHIERVRTQVIVVTDAFPERGGSQVRGGNCNAN